MKLEIGSKIGFVIDENGTVKVIILNIPVTALSGMLRRPGAAATIAEDMDYAIAQGSSDWT